MCRRTTVLIGLIASISAACGNSSDDATPGSAAPSARGPGVTEDQIRVSVIAPLTNPLGTDYSAYVDGIQAYFDMVNDDGGVFGKKLTIAKTRDDQLANNTAEINAALAEDNPFAIMTAPLIFDAGAQLEEEGIPTFVWGIDAAFSGPKNIFTESGYVGRYPNPMYPFVIASDNRSKIGLLSYNDAASGNCAKDFQQAMERWPVAPIAFADTSYSFGDLGALPADVSKMKDEGVDIVYTCLDQNGVLSLGQEMRKQRLEAVQILLNGYDPEFMRKHADVFEGSIVEVSYAPIETSPPPKGVADYVAAMDAAGYRKTELAMVGWLNAAHLVFGIDKAGAGFTRERVIDALNSTTEFDADGMVAPIDWTTEHTTPNDDECTAWVRVKAGAFEPILAPPGKAFSCIPVSPSTLPAEPTRFVG